MSETHSSEKSLPPAATRQRLVTLFTAAILLVKLRPSQCGWQLCTALWSQARGAAADRGDAPVLQAARSMIAVQA